MSLPVVKSIGSLQQYKDYISQFPVLSKEEERELFNQYNLGDDSVVSTLILHNLRYVVHIVYNEFNVADTPDSLQADLIQEGNIGLIEAVPKFDVSFNVRFVAFAHYHIKHRIINYLKNNRTLIKTNTTKALSKLHNHYDKVEHANLVETLNVTEKDIKKYETLSSLTFHRINGDEDEDNVGNTLTSGLSVLDDLLQEEYQGYVKKVREVVGELDERRRDIFVARNLTETPMGLKELATRYGISNERVRQLELQAVEQITKRLGIER